MLPARCPSIWARWWQALRLVATRNGGRCREAPSGKTPSEEKPRGKTTGHQTKFRENPRRSLIKRQHADWFRPFTITAAGTTLHAYGNLELLRAPRRQAVRISSRITAEECNRQQQELLTAARQGTILISPFISTGERFVEETALQEHLPIVKLLPNGFSPYYKPQGHYFEACGEGRLLFLTPYPYSTQKVVLTRSVCNYLNVLAARLC